MKMAAAPDPGYINISEDGGVTWTVQTNSGTNRWRSITMSDDGTRLAAVESQGNWDPTYIVTSTDSGVTWIAQTGSAQLSWKKVAMSEDGMKIFAIADNAIYTSEDGGVAWTKQNTGDAGGNWSDIASSANGDKLAASASTYNKFDTIHASSGNGEDWNELSVSGVSENKRWYSVAVSNDGTKLAACVYDGYIYTSTDSGVNWAERTSSSEQPWRAVHISDDGLKIAAGSRGNDGQSSIYLSDDGGVTWSKSNFESFGLSKIAGSYTGEKYVVATMDGVSVSTDGGSTWANRYGSVKSVDITSDGTKIVLVDDNSKIKVSSDDGLNWVEYQMAERYWNSVSISDDGVKLAATTSSTPIAHNIYTSSNNGVNWSQIEGSGDTISGWVSIASSSDGNYLAAITGPANGRIRVSSDGGVTWNISTISLPSPKDIAISNNGKIAIITESTLYLSDDNGTTWSNSSIPVPSSAFAIHISNDGQSIVVAQSNDTISMTTDDGTTWDTASLPGSVSAVRHKFASSENCQKLVAAPSINSSSRNYIYTSTDSGSTWAPRGYDLPWDAVASSSDGATLTAITRSDFVTNAFYGVISSSDAGEVWAELVGSHNLASILLTVNVAPSGSFIALGASTDFIKTSTDGGLTWIVQDGSVKRNWHNIAISSTGEVMAAVQSSTTDFIYVSTDSGVTWNTQTSSGNKEWRRIAMSYDGTSMAAVQSSTDFIYVSTNSGSTWTKQTSSGSRTWNRIAMSDVGTIRAATTSGVGGKIFISTNGGSVWTERYTATAQYVTDIAISANGTRMAAITNQYIYISTDSGVNWTSKTSTGIKSWTGIAMSPDGTNMAAVHSSSGFIYTSTDSGDTWVAKTSSGTRLWISVAVSADGKIYATNESGKRGYGRCYIFTSSDSGINWIEQTASPRLGWKRIAVSNNGLNMVAADTEGRLATSTDSGLTWNSYAVSWVNSSLLDLAASDNGDIFALRSGTITTDQHIYTSTDSGVTWIEQTGSDLKNWKKVAMSSDGSNVVALANGNDYIYMSTNGGVAWMQKTDSGERSWFDVVLSNVGSLFAINETTTSTDDYIYTSTDSGTTWMKQTNSGLKSWVCVAMSSDGSKVAAAAEGSSYVYTSTNGGESWATQTVGADANFIDIVMSDAGDKLAGIAFPRIYLSVDGGVNWSEQDSIGLLDWQSVAMSSDGNKIAAAPYYDNIYTYDGSLTSVDLVVDYTIKDLPA